MTNIINTIKTRKDFLVIRNHGKKVVDRFFIMQYLYRDFLDQGNLDKKNKILNNFYKNIRFGFVITKKIGNAVIRNKIRRRFKAILQQSEILKKNYNKDCDIIIVPRYHAKDVGFSKIRNSVNYRLKECFST